MTEPAPPKGIRLRAEDAEDLKVVAACLQDAIVPIGEVGWLPDQQCFAMMVSRFCWEVCDAGGNPFWRVNCALTVQGVSAVRRRRIDLHDRALILNLLTLQHHDDGIDLIFAGDGVIHLTAPRWRCYIEDVGEPWPTGTQPCHPVAPESEPG